MEFYEIKKISLVIKCFLTSLSLSNYTKTDDLQKTRLLAEQGHLGAKKNLGYIFFGDEINQNDATAGCK